ncbi:hypothetical protein SDC9_120721 [bioreactor metagenome]|uniref:Uncharacterized protein n=1 Tax=bioreactor metagenome TaxID=1076179 RepID=A0A645C9Y4_9ZZZZ
MKAPAEAALAPLGETHTTTGTFDSSIAVVIPLMELTSPPGVSSRKTTSVACSRSALSRTSTAKRSMAIPTVPSRGAARTKAAAGTAGKSSRTAERTTTAIRRSLRFISSPPSGHHSVSPPSQCLWGLSSPPVPPWS